MMKKKCLWVVPKAIFPVRDGARVANQAMIKSMRPHFEKIDLLMFNESLEEAKQVELYQTELGVDHVFFIRKISFSSLAKKLLFFLKSFLMNPKEPVTTAYFEDKEIISKITEILNSNQYDTIIFDGLHPFRVFKNIKNIKKYELIYRAHNVESDLWVTAASKTNNSLFRKALLWQAKKMQRLESKMIKKSKAVWCISEEDQKRFGDLNPSFKEKLALIPVGLTFKELEKTKAPDNKIQLLFLGKMDWAPNKDGLKWLLEEVWPLIDHQKLELQIVGSGDSTWLRDLVKQPAITFFGFVDSIDEFYAKSDFSIIPIRYGSGTRIKVIESISKGLPIISTEMGVQGSGLVDYLKAETKEEWIHILNNLSKDQGYEFGKKAFKQLREVYGPEVIAQKAIGTLR